ncbi:unnamed protein product [Mytilus edulis]|uniref:Uncharacterized protein n=1 Tax=Mytilus edulis TaxID=6550 RepID=A0A8S3S9L6_MYTED|nr:unnamed protein product [Mytilus edulis]
MDVYIKSFSKHISYFQDFIEVDNLRRLQYANADVMLLAFEYNNPASFYSIEDKWVGECLKYSKHAKILLVGVQSALEQHAGELILEWQDSCFNPYMPGMIVSGTKVVMTLLHITQDHVNRLKNGWDLLPDEDKATIYYGKPLDLLVKEDRDILLETLFKLSLMNRNIDWFPG